MPWLRNLWQRGRIWWISALSGALLGLLLRAILLGPLAKGGGSRSGLLVTLGFLLGVPMVLGYLTVQHYLAKTPTNQVRWYAWLFLPWASVVLMALVLYAFAWEGLICILMAAPLMLFGAMLGGIVAWTIHTQIGDSRSTTVSALALPLLVCLIEARIGAPWKITAVRSEIFVRAPAATVWTNIKSVAAIQPGELPSSWVNIIGFPRPIAATLSRDHVGGVREASFSGGLVFTETVNLWAPERDLRFSIRANTESIPRSTLDEHITIGGAYFDVLDGEYTLEEKPGGVLLHLTSHERVSTHLNPYAELWTDAIMQAVQRQILTVVRNRCEKSPGANAGPRSH